MFRSLDEVLVKVKSLPPVTVAVAQAADREVLEAVYHAKKLGIANFLLVGNRDKILAIAQSIGLDHSLQIEQANTPEEACSKAVSAVREGKADVVMKGLVHSADFLRAVLNKEKGLRSGRVLSHVATFEVAGYDRLIHVTDPALNIAPSLQEKKQIIENVIEYCRSLGNVEPKIAVLGAVEVINPKMQPTVDAAILAQMSRRRQITGAIVDGPFGLDNAISMKAAAHKGIESPVAGAADVLLVPDIEAGNILYKSLVYFAKSKIGAVVLGAKAPVVLTSRADSAKSRLYSIALSVLHSSHQTLAVH